ncbi:MAG: hypothetical protein WBD22_02150 [Pyrinomonadaceae bacterium]
MRFCLVLLLLISFARCNLPIAQTRPAASSSFALTNVSVVDIRRGIFNHKFTVIIERGRIAEIGETGRINVPANVRKIDSSGKFLIPGLWDMHVHTFFRSRPEAFLSLFVANGGHS